MVVHFMRVKNVLIYLSSSIRGFLTFWRVISRICSGVISTALHFTGSFRRYFCKTREQLVVVIRICILIKSMRMIPDKLRRRSCLAISFAASRLIFDRFLQLFLSGKFTTVYVYGNERLRSAGSQVNPPLFSQIFSF